MKGSLAEQGVIVSQRRVASAMRQVAPHPYYQRRQRTAEQVNPIYHIMLATLVTRFTLTKTKSWSCTV